MAGHGGYESWLERDHLMWLDWDWDWDWDWDRVVVGMAAQPFWLSWTGPAGRDVAHAPDFFARRVDGSVVVVVVDCRPVDRRPARDTGPWTPAVHTLLRHLERVGFDAAPRLVGSGLDPDGRETLTYIDGEFTQPGPWSLDGAAAVGQLLRDLHQATATYQPAPDAIWFPWHGRKLGGSARVIGQCDVAPWNIVARDRTPVAFIDWEFAGPVDPLVELAQTCWLNAKLHDDIVAEREGLPLLADRARQLRAIIDAYGLPADQRRGLLDRIIEYVISDTANEADDANVTPDMTSHPCALWAMAWRARAAAWLIRNRRPLENALV